MSIFDSLGVPLARSGSPRTSYTGSIVFLRQADGKQDTLGFDSQWSLLYASGMNRGGSMGSILRFLNYSRHLLVIFFALGYIFHYLPWNHDVGTGVFEVHPADSGGSAICKLGLINDFWTIFPKELEGLEEAYLG